MQAGGSVACDGRVHVAVLADQSRAVLQYNCRRFSPERDSPKNSRHLVDGGTSHEVQTATYTYMLSTVRSWKRGRMGT